MLTVEVSTSGLEFDDVAQKLSVPLRQKLVEKLADIAWAYAVWNAPRKTGYLASTVAKEVGDGKASINVLASYAMYVVKGTRPHIIRPVNASVLAFEAADGRMVFTSMVRHPGTKPNPFLQNTVEAARSEAEETFAKLWLEMLS
jgi:hypothetical protein